MFTEAIGGGQKRAKRKFKKQPFSETDTVFAAFFSQFLFSPGFETLLPPSLSFTTVEDAVSRLFGQVWSKPGGNLGVI